LRFQPGQGAGERRTGAVDEGPASFLGVKQAKDNDLEIGIAGGVDHDERAVADGTQDLGHTPWAAESDVLQRDAADVVGADGPPALLGDEVAQVRGGVPEGRVLGEFCGADRDRFTPTLAQWMSPAVNRPASK
jgi:hypothetical protein